MNSEQLADKIQSNVDLIEILKNETFEEFRKADLCDDILTSLVSNIPISHKSAAALVEFWKSFVQDFEGKYGLLNGKINVYSLVFLY